MHINQYKQLPISIQNIGFNLVCIHINNQYEYYINKFIIQMQQSPLKNKEYNQLQEQKRSIITDLQYLFTQYASKTSRHNYRQLNHKFFIEMLNNALGREPDRKKRQLDSEKQKRFEQLQQKFSILYYSKGVKQGVTFQQFLNFLPTLAVIIYDELDTSEATKLLIQTLRNLYQVEVQQKLSGKVINMDFNFDEEIRKYILKLHNEFNKIYKAYFPHQKNNNLKNSRYEDQSLKCYFEFLKDFQVLPKLITAGHAYLIFRQTLNLKDAQIQFLPKKQKEELTSRQQKRTESFTLNKFISSLVMISSNTYRKLKQYSEDEEIEQNKKEQFKTLLEYIEMTKAYKKQRHLKQTNQSFSFIVLQQYPKQANLKTVRLSNSIVREPKEKLQFMDILKSMNL